MASSTVEIDGQRLRTHRTRRGYSQQSLADRVGISRSYLADLERGRRDKPRRMVAKAIADALGLELSEIMP